MIVLGVNYYFHDSTACLVKDGQLLVAIEEERLTRKKHTGAFPTNAIARCLSTQGLAAEDVDHVALSICPAKDWAKKLAYGAQHITSAKPFLKHELWNGYFKQRTFREWFKGMWSDRARAPRTHFVPHHASHAAGTFFVSPYDSAAILSLDGSGEWSTSFLGQGEGVDVQCYHESCFPMSMGAFYEAVTEFCGFRPNYDEGKTMGLAPMGDPDRFHKAVSELIEIGDDGEIRIDLSYFNYQFWGYRRCGPKFYETFGQPRERTGEFAQNHLDTAAAFQRVLEERALELCRILKSKSGSRHLVLAGGVSLNSVMNGRIARESEFDDIYVMPAAGDNGTAIGAAYYVYNKELGNPRSFVHDDPFIGNEYTDSQVDAIIRECKLQATRHDSIEAVGAALLRDGNILGWHQGRMEIGPRALGNRSILANPTLAHMKDKLNAEVKHREAYRPFAPSALMEEQHRFFEDLGENPFMLKVCDVLPGHDKTLPAITHVDGSARLQTVHKETNPRYHELIRQFGELTGIPVLLNTSFNIMGEPIVESPIDAIRCFFSTGIDALIIGSFLLRK